MDIVEKIRHAKAWLGGLAQEAADEIERLRTRVAELEQRDIDSITGTADDQSLFASDDDGSN